MHRLLLFVCLNALSALSVNCYAQQPAVDPAKLTEYLQAMQEQMLQMHDLSNKILAETDPQKQQALKAQQLELMKAQYLRMLSQQHPG
jgi:hypothetical protein